MTTNGVLNSRTYTVENVVDKLSNRGLMLVNKSVLTRMNSEQMSQEKVQLVRMFEHNFSKDNKYFPFQIMHWSDSDKFKLSSFLCQSEMKLIINLLIDPAPMKTFLVMFLLCVTMNHLNINNKYDELKWMITVGDLFGGNNLTAYQKISYLVYMPMSRF